MVRPVVQVPGLGIGAFAAATPTALTVTRANRLRRFTREVPSPRTATDLETPPFRLQGRHFQSGIYVIPRETSGLAVRLGQQSLGGPAKRGHQVCAIPGAGGEHHLT